MTWKLISKSSYSLLLGELETKQENNQNIYRITVAEKHLNSGNFAHGGFLMSVLDNVMGNTAYKSFGNRPCVTISMNTHFTFSAQKGDELIGIPSVERMTKTLCFVKCEVFSKNEIIVSGNGIWKLVKTSLSKSVKDKKADDDGGW